VNLRIPITRGDNLDENEVIRCLDYTLLEDHIDDEEIINFCKKANMYQPATVCIFPEKIRIAKRILDPNIPITAVAGNFPIGSHDGEKIGKDIMAAINLGADEIDVVLEPRNTEDFPNEIELNKLKRMRSAAKGKVLKVIIETPLLNERKKRSVTRMALAVGVDFVKTCTGKRGSCTEEDVKILSYELMRHELTFNEKLGMKISGGIKDKDTVMKFIGIINDEDSTIIPQKRFRIGASSLIDKLVTI
jgi:deoxyribose-phosphate aldolase